MKLDRLEIRKFRNVAPGTTLEFSPRFNVLLGRNGAGKTTLLKLIACLFKGDLRAFANEPFDIAWRMSWRRWNEEGTISGVASNEVVEWRYRVDVVTSDGHRTFYGASSTGAVESSERRSSPYQPMFDSSDWGAIHVAVMIARSRLWTSLLDTRSTGRFDESTGAFGLILGQDPVLADAGPTIVEISVGDPDDGRHILDTQFTPYDVRGAAAPHEPPRLSSDTFTSLATAAAALGVREVVLTARFKSAENDVRRYAGFDIEVRQHGGNSVSGQDLSYGQKRMLSFLYYVASSPDVVIADELENGLHWEWMEKAVEAIGSRQAFLTSQNPLLIDVLPLGSLEEVERTFLQCRSKGETPVLSWTHLTRRQATDVWEARQVGIRQLGEILRAHGLW